MKMLFQDGSEQEKFCEMRRTFMASVLSSLCPSLFLFSRAAAKEDIRSAPFLDGTFGADKTSPPEGSSRSGNNDDAVIVSQLKASLYHGKSSDVANLVKALLDRGWPPYRVYAEALQSSMAVVGDDFRNGVIFVPEVLLASNAMKAGLAILKPLLVETGAPKRGRMVIGTVKGDVHDIGKSIVSMMVEGAGCEVIDIGINNEAKDFISALKEFDADILGMSAMLTSTSPYMKRVIDELRSEGIRQDYIVLVGGAALNEDSSRSIGADAYCPDALAAVSAVTTLMDVHEGNTK